METGAYGVEIGGAIYFAIFITIGAFIGINLLVVVVTTNPSTFRIVDEVRSIRFNQEQEEELMQRHLSWNMSLESRSSVDIREMTREQDLITALVNRKRVQLLSFPLLHNQCLPSPATTPLVKVQESNTNINKRKASS